MRGHLNEIAESRKLIERNVDRITQIEIDLMKPQTTNRNGLLQEAARLRDENTVSRRLIAYDECRGK